MGVITADRISSSGQKVAARMQGGRQECSEPCHRQSWGWPRLRLSPRGCSTPTPLQLGQGRGWLSTQGPPLQRWGGCGKQWLSHSISATPPQQRQWHRIHSNGLHVPTEEIHQNYFPSATSFLRKGKKKYLVPSTASQLVCSHSEIPNSTAPGAPSIVLNSWKKYHAASNSFCLWYWGITWCWLLWQSCRKLKKLNNTTAKLDLKWMLHGLCSIVLSDCLE